MTEFKINKSKRNEDQTRDKPIKIVSGEIIFLKTTTKLPPADDDQPDYVIRDELPINE